MILLRVSFSNSPDEIAVIAGFPLCGKLIMYILLGYLDETLGYWGNNVFYDLLKNMFALIQRDCDLMFEYQFHSQYFGRF